MSSNEGNSTPVNDKVLENGLEMKSYANHATCSCSHKFSNFLFKKDENSGKLEQKQHLFGFEMLLFLRKHSNEFFSDI